jgi:exodeoxyribonuclease V alpha subunit
MLLMRNMLYTAVTRAQNMVIIVGEREVVQKMVDNDRQSLRFTGLKRLFEK